MRDLARTARTCHNAGTCRFPASGSPTGFTARHTARGTKVSVRGAARAAPRPTTAPDLNQNSDDLKVGAAVDDESSQNNEKQNCGGDRSPVMFGAPWVGPPTIVVRATSAFKVLVDHIPVHFVISIG
jgi:hypothetical protein